MTARGRTIALALESRGFEGTRRAWWIRVPAGVDPGAPSGVMIFNDGVLSGRALPEALKWLWRP